MLTRFTTVCAFLGTVLAVGNVAPARGANPWANYRFAPDALQEIDLASDTDWTLSVDGGPPRRIRVPAGGWNSDQQQQPIDTMTGVNDYVVYERTIQVPKVADDQVTKILFGAVNYGADVFIDGKLVASHAGPLTPFEADLTGVVTPGLQYTLKVKAYHRRHYHHEPPPGFIVKRGRPKTVSDVPVGFDFPAGSEDWCHWAGNTKFAYGITKHVKLAVYPSVFIQDVFIKPSVSKDSLEVLAWVRNSSPNEKTLTIRGELASWNGDAWKYPAVPAAELSVPGGTVKQVLLGPFRWGLRPESYWWPNIPFREDYIAKLHNLKLDLREGSTVWHRRTDRFGFCEHAEGPYYYTVNGVRVTNISDGTVESQMSAYDAYSTSPAFLPPTGPSTGCPETWRRYLRIGINANRVCCGMPTEYMMQAADEVGFMLMPEGVTWGNGLSRYHEVYTPQTIREMARLCRNHPSVVRYSLTNEVLEPVDGDFPWRALIDVMLEEDDTRPLVYELGAGREPGRIDGLHRGHAYINSHYRDIGRGGDFIRSMGECAWATDGMAAFGLMAMHFRLNDWAYFAPWSWINYWPNFLEGMSHDQHAWKRNNGPDRRDGADGWDSPLVTGVQRSLHPYLVLDRNLLEVSPVKRRGASADVKVPWPQTVPRYAAGSTVARAIELFNGGLSRCAFELKWEARWDAPEGELLRAGRTNPVQIEAGFHVTQTVEFALPPSIQRERELYLVLESVKDGETVYREDRLRLRIFPAGASVSDARSRGLDEKPQKRRVPLESKDVTVAMLLKQAGYITGMTGKWGLGEPDTTGIPSKKGFHDRPVRVPAARRYSSGVWPVQRRNTVVRYSP